MEHLLSKEQNHRQNTGKERRIRAAQLPFHKTLTDFDYGFQPGISQRQMKQLAEMAWLEGAYNILFLGPPGVGKTHLAVALGMAAIDAGYRVYFTTMDQLISNLKTEAISTRSQKQLRTLYKAHLVILDEVGFMPINKQEANLLFQVVTKLYQKTSVILTSNKGLKNGENSWATQSSPQPY